MALGRGINQTENERTVVQSDCMCARVLYLFDGDGDSDGVDGSFYLHLLFLIPTHHYWRHQQFLATPETHTYVHKVDPQ